MLDWFFDLIRSFFSLFDRMVYWFIELLISLFDQLSSINIFNDTVMKNFSTRIYFLISIIMLFKVSFSIIKYIINPDTFKDNEKGMGKIIQSIILVLVCLSLSGKVFEFAYNLQSKVIESRIIEKVILGIEPDLKEAEQINTKNSIPFTLLSSFIRPYTEKVGEFDYDPDKGVYTCNMDGISAEMYEITEIRDKMDDNKVSYSLGNYNPKFGECIGKVSREGHSKVFQKGDGTCTGCTTGEMYNEAWESYRYSYLLDLINDRATNGEYLFDYKFVISTAAGVFVVIMYLNFCIDLAIRSVKFGFLQLIAPIPILSMIDPKSAKSGMMSKWAKNCLNTYLGLFIRIAAVSFVVLVVNLVFTQNNITSGGSEVNVFVKIVVLFGALMFAKELPKLITDLTGIDFAGNFKLNPFSRIPGVKVANKLGGAAITGAVGGIGGAIAAGVATGQNGKNAGAIVGSTLMGLGRGVFGGMKSGYCAGLNGAIGKTRDTVHGINDRYKAYGSSTLGGRIGYSIRDTFGRSKADEIDAEIKVLEDYAKFKGQMKAQADFDTSDLMESAKGNLADALGSGVGNVAIENAAKNGVKGLKEYYEDLKNSGTATASEISTARDAYEKAQQYVINNADTGVLKIYDASTGGYVKNDNGAVAAIKDQAKNYASRHSAHSDVMKTAAKATTYKEISQATIDAQNEAITKRDATYDQAVANRDAVNATRKNK